MSQPTWREVRKLAVPDQPGRAWTLALELVTAGRLLKIEVASGQTWTPDGFSAPCDADGDITASNDRDRPLLTGVPIGALIGRVGGSSADQAVDAARMLLFAVGRVCVLPAPDTTKGALFLGANDKPALMSKLTGQLSVTISEAL